MPEGLSLYHRHQRNGGLLRDECRPPFLFFYQSDP